MRRVAPSENDANTETLEKRLWDAVEINKPSKSLHRMLAPRGNPNTENFFGIVRALQKKTRVKLRVTAKAA